jgi:hypothetical protein
VRALWGVLGLVAVSTGCGRIAFDDVGGDGDGAVGPGLVARTIEITNPSTSTLPAGYAVSLPLGALPAASHQADLADVHVVGVSGTRLDRIVDHDNTGAATQLWFALDADIAASASDNRYTLLYGDPTDASPLQDGTNVFASYDDFNGTTLQSSWLKQGTPQIGGGELRILAGTNGDGVASMPATDGVPLVASLEIRLQVTDPTSAPRRSLSPNSSSASRGTACTVTPIIPRVTLPLRSCGSRSRTELIGTAKPMPMLPLWRASE